MTYPVQAFLDEGDFAVRLKEIGEWLDRHAVHPATLRYRTFADRVQVRIDFIALRDATLFSEVFGGQAPARGDGGDRRGALAEINRGRRGVRQSAVSA